jgi:hypothetical protein
MIDWFEAHMGTCAFVKYLNIECPGCGIQRAFIALLKGEFAHSIRLFPALIPYITTILLLVIQVIFQFKKGAYIIMYSFIISVIIMTISYIIKLVI